MIPLAINVGTATLLVSGVMGGWSEAWRECVDPGARADVVEDERECEGEEAEGVTGVCTEGAGGSLVSVRVGAVPCRICAEKNETLHMKSQL